jgi:hypothetical protein
MVFFGIISTLEIPAKDHRGFITSCIGFVNNHLAFP